MIRTYLLNRNELQNISYPESILSDGRKAKIEKVKREEGKQLSACAELLLIYAVKQQLPAAALPLSMQEDERQKLRFNDLPLYFNLSHAREYAVCSLSDEPVGVDIEYFRDRELMSPDRILHPEEYQLLQFISNSNEKKKYFYECWVAKESYLKNLGIGLIVRPRDFLVREDRLLIGMNEYKPQKGHHTSKIQADPTKVSELTQNLSYLEPRYVHVLEPGEVRGTDWKFDAGYRVAVCSLHKDPDSTARLLHAKDINDMLSFSAVFSATEK